ncbi:MAG: helix-turn-helix transcriptional regulator [Rhizobiaceae bacterium]
MKNTQGVDLNHKKKKKLGELLRSHRRKLGMNQAEVAAKAFGPSASNTQISHYENGKYIPQATNLRALTVVLEIPWQSVEEILDSKDEKTADKRLVYRSIPMEIRLGTRLATRSIGQPFSRKLFYFSMTLSQMYSMTVIALCWLFVPEVSYFANLNFLPDWPFLLRLLLVSWGVLVVGLTVGEVLRTGRQADIFKHQKPLLDIKRKSLSWLLPLWITCICLVLWVGSEFYVWMLSVFVLLYAHRSMLVSFAFATFSVLSISVTSILNAFFDSYYQLNLLAFAIVLSGSFAAVSANHLMFNSLSKLRWNWLISASLAVCAAFYANYNFISDRYQVALSLLPVVLFATFLFRHSTSDESPVHPVHRLGIIIFLFATFIVLCWPSLLRDSTTSTIWPIFFVFLPASNAICDFLSISCTLQSLAFLSNSGKSAGRFPTAFLNMLMGLANRVFSTVKGDSRRREFATVASAVIFEVISIIAILLLLVVLIGASLSLTDWLVTSTFSTEFGLEQLVSTETNSSIWVSVLLATVFVPTVAVAIWMYFFATRTPVSNLKEEGLAGRSRINLLRMELEREKARSWLGRMFAVFCLVAYLTLFYGVEIWVAEAIRLLS